MDANLTIRNPAQRFNAMDVTWWLGIHSEQLLRARAAEPVHSYLMSGNGDGLIGETVQIRNNGPQSRHLFGTFGPCVAARSPCNLGVNIQPALIVSPATLNDHEGVAFGEHHFVNVLSPSSSSVAS
jgi:hypothetical protein